MYHEIERVMRSGSGNEHAHEFAHCCLGSNTALAFPINCLQYWTGKFLYIFKYLSLIAKYSAVSWIPYFNPFWIPVHYLRCIFWARLWWLKYLKKILVFREPTPYQKFYPSCLVPFWLVLPISCRLFARVYVVKEVEARAPKAPRTTTRQPSWSKLSISLKKDVADSAPAQLLIALAAVLLFRVFSAKWESRFTEPAEPRSAQRDGIFFCLVPAPASFQPKHPRCYGAQT